MQRLRKTKKKGQKMKIALGDRTPETVAVYFEKAQNPKIKAVLPQKAQTLEEALEDYRLTLLPTASSFGKTILADGRYVGDVWCYGIDPSEEPGAMVSFCIFEERLWSKGIGTKALALFLAEIRERYSLRTVGAFSYAENAASIRVLEKNGFTLREEFTEDGRASKYLQMEFTNE